MINIKYDINTIENKRSIIKKLMFENSENIKSENFSQISEVDLNILFKLYDEVFLKGWFKDNFKGKIIFKLSKQLSRAAGNTRTKKNISSIKPDEVKFEVKISLNHMAGFNKTDGPKYVGGIEAVSVLDSLMLVFEHELCHVIEFLICFKSSCRKKPFKDLIFNLFGHTETTHKLVNINEVNSQSYGLKPGDSVKFRYNGKIITGFIQRINKKATVMCPDNTGGYVDKAGKRYKKFYAEPDMLIKID